VEPPGSLILVLRSFFSSRETIGVGKSDSMVLSHNRSVRRSNSTLNGKELIIMNSLKSTQQNRSSTEHIRMKERLNIRMKERLDTHKEIH
jgi:hypothetical protein